MLDEIADERVPRPVGYIIMFLGVFSLLLSLLFFFEELMNRFYTHDMAPGGYLGSALPTLLFGVILLFVAYIICPSVFGKEVEKEVEGDSGAEELQDIL